MAQALVGKLFEWYGGSGGQLKYYPLTGWAIWKSEPFMLEPLKLRDEEAGIAAKAAAYFPTQWKAVQDRLIIGYEEAPSNIKVC